MKANEHNGFFENKCIKCSGYSGCFASVLKKSEFLSLQSKLGRKILDKDEILFYENKTVRNIYRVIEGDVKLTYGSNLLKPIIMRMAHGFDYLGLEGLLLGSSYTMTASALNESVLCVIPKQAIDEYLENNADVCKNIYLEIQKEQERIFKFSILLLSGLSESKLAYALLILSDKNNIIKTSKEDIALMIGLRRETVSRLIRRLKAKNLIESNRRFIKIINRKEIEQLSINIKKDGLS